MRPNGTPPDGTPADGMLVLRDIHQPAAPPWWPPAPGWWAMAGVVLLLVIGFGALRWRRRRKLARIGAFFDAEVARADGNAMQVAAISELLRRAARRRDPHADTVQGDAWLALLDEGAPGKPFTQGAGRVLLEGGFRRDVDAQAVTALREVARDRFIGWMLK